MLIPPTLMTVDELGARLNTHVHTNTLHCESLKKEMTLTKLSREVSPLHTAFKCLSNRKPLYKCVHIITSALPKETAK